MPDEPPSPIAEHAYTAARADMEFRTTLTAARHHIENLLNAFSHAVCSGNATALEELTYGVAVRLNGHTPCGKSKPTTIIDWFAHTNPATTQTITNISLRFDDSAVIYSATYQDWETVPSPRCTAIGRFNGRLKTGPQVWRWETHEVTALGSLDERPATARHLSSATTRRKTLQSTR